MKKLIISILLITPIIAFSQDTIYVNKVKICNVVYTKSGHVYKKFFKNIKVRTGYIVNLGNGIYNINGKLMKGEFDSLIAKK